MQGAKSLGDWPLFLSGYPTSANSSLLLSLLAPLSLYVPCDFLTKCSSRLPLCRLWLKLAHLCGSRYLACAFDWEEEVEADDRSQPEVDADCGWDRPAGKDLAAPGLALVARSLVAWGRQGARRLAASESRAGGWAGNGGSSRGLYWWLRCCCWRSWW